MSKARIGAWIPFINDKRDVHDGTHVARPNLEALRAQLSVLDRGSVVLFDKRHGQPWPPPDKFDRLPNDLLHSHRGLNDVHKQNEMAHDLGHNVADYVGGIHHPDDMAYMRRHTPGAAADAVWQMTGRAEIIVVGSLMTQIARLSTGDEGDGGDQGWAIDFVSELRQRCAVLGEGHGTAVGRSVFEGIFLMHDAFGHNPSRYEGAAKRYGEHSMVAVNGPRWHHQEAADEAGLTRMHFHWHLESVLHLQESAT